MPSESVLDVGCGSSKLVGATGIDQFSLPGVDVIHDLNKCPWPFQDEYFDRIVFSHSLSHLTNISEILSECHRLLKPGGVIEIVAPHYSSDNFNTDPTHKMHLGYRSMNYFVTNVPFGYRYISPSCGFELKEAQLSFRECKTSWRQTTKFNPLALMGFEILINMFPRLYERFFCWLMPASEVYFRLVKSPTPGSIC